jgi:cation transport regulator
LRKTCHARIEDLPDSVRKNLPEHAQEIYREAFNHAWTEYADPKKRRDDSSLEEVTHRVAWAAVKKQYEKDEKTGIWKKK